MELVLQPVNILQAQSSLSRLAQAIEQGQAREIVIARNGRPAAKLVPIDTVPAGKRIGVAKGLFAVPDSIDAHNVEVAQLFLGGALPVPRSAWQKLRGEPASRPFKTIWALRRLPDDVA